MSKVLDLMREISDLQTKRIYNQELQYKLMEKGLMFQDQINQKKKELAELEDLEDEKYSRSVQDESSMAGEPNE